MKSYSQQEIDELISCQKVITEKPKEKMILDRRGHWRNGMILTSADGHYNFTVFMRRNEKFPENFSIGLIFNPSEERGSLILIRFNGPHGDFLDKNSGQPHHNGYHIHKSDAELLDEGVRSERFATRTEVFASYEEALAHFIKITNIKEADKCKYLSKTEQMILSLQEKEDKNELS